MKSMMKTLKVWQRLFWAGPLLTIAGLSAGVVAGTWVPIPLALISAGCVISLFWLVLQASQGGFWGRRSTQAGTNAIVATLAVLVILGLINFLGSRYVQRLDLTENRLFTLAPQSQQVLQKLKRPVKVVVFLQQPDAGLRALLEEYQRRGQQFSFEFINPASRPQIAQTFGVQDFGDVFLESGDRRQFVQSVKYERLSEGKLTASLERLASDRQLKVYFLQGHGERDLQVESGGLSQAKLLLEEKNFVSEPLNLSQQTSIPTDAAVIVIAGPKQPLLEGEVKALSSYLDRGGSLLVMVDPNTNPGLEPLWQAWGVKLENLLAINASEQQVAGLGPVASVVSEYGDHPITKQFKNRFSIYPFARPIELTPVKEVKQTPLLVTGPKSWAKKNLQSENLQLNPAEGDRPGPLVLGAALTKPVSATATPTTPTPSPTPGPSPTVSPSPTPAPAKPAAEARLVVLGNSTFASNSLFSQQINSDVFLNSISWLSQQDDPVLSIRPKEVKNRRLTMTPIQLNLLILTAVALMPLLALSTAAFVWWQRR